MNGTDFVHAALIAAFAGAVVWAFGDLKFALAWAIGLFVAMLIVLPIERRRRCRSQSGTD